MNPGDKISNFKFQATREVNGELSDYQGKWLVLYFYPKDATPGCTTEGQDFRDAYPAFKQLNCDILGVSRDSLASHERFKEKQQFPFELISDADEELCRLFDVIKLKNMYGRQVMGIERSTFLIDPQGRLAESFRKVKVKGHVDAVLECLKNKQ